MQFLPYFNFQGIYKRSLAKREIQKSVFVDKEKAVETGKQNKTPKLDHTYSTNFSPTKMQAKFKVFMHREKSFLVFTIT